MMKSLRSLSILQLTTSLLERKDLTQEIRGSRSLRHCSVCAIFHQPHSQSLSSVRRIAQAAPPMFCASTHVHCREENNNRWLFCVPVCCGSKVSHQRSLVGNFRHHPSFASQTVCTIRHTASDAMTYLSILLLAVVHWW